MKRRYVLYAASLTASLSLALLAGCQTTPQPKAQVAPAAAEQVVISKLKGKIKTNVNKNRTISLTVEGKGLVVVKYDDATRLVNAPSFKDLHPDEILNVEYRTVGSENIATLIGKVVAEIPQGVTLMGLEEAYDLVRKGPVAGKYTMFDSRPPSRYHEGHIPGSKSLPFAEMEKADKEGKLLELLPKEKDKLLVFYCGGVT
jgi:hypothetical protein